jgi:hypothetical protein
VPVPRQAVHVLFRIRVVFLHPAIAAVVIAVIWKTTADITANLEMTTLFIFGLPLLGQMIQMTHGS